MQSLLKRAQQIWHCLVEWCELSSIGKSYKIEFLLVFVIVVPPCGGKNVL